MKLKFNALNYTRSCLLCFLLVGCSPPKPYIPNCPEALSVSSCEEFKVKLLQAYEEGDDFQVAFQLANLKAPNELVYKHLKNAVQNNVNHCESIFDMNRMAVDHGFYQNPYKADTARFYGVFNLCLKMLGEDAYEKFDQKEKLEEEAYRNNRPKLDSSLLIPDLIEILSQALEDDQKYRAQLGDQKLDFSAKDREQMWSLQSRLDSINLLRIDTVLTHHGYPGTHQVGHELVDVVWLVLHHQVDISVRKKYLKEIEIHLSEGQLEVYNQRTRNLESR